jgi:hypothetical protein
MTRRAIAVIRESGVREPSWLKLKAAAPRMKFGITRSIHLLGQENLVAE